MNVHVIAQSPFLGGHLSCLGVDKCFPTHPALEYLCTTIFKILELHLDTTFHTLQMSLLVTDSPNVPASAFPIPPRCGLPIFLMLCNDSMSGTINCSESFFFLDTQPDCYSACLVDSWLCSCTTGINAE